MTSTTPTPTTTTTTTTTQHGSLTPLERADEAVHAANMEGIINGIMTLVPSIVTVGLLVRNNATFAARTNMQSRTAIAIMPAMFISALSSELTLSYRMKQMAMETQHGTDTVHWAETQMALQQQQQQQSATQQEGKAVVVSHNNPTQQQLATLLYQQSVAASGVCIVPQLHWYHHVANYTSQYPFRVLSALAIPSVAYIFYGRTEQQHLVLSQKIMHTRVLGQFTTISLLLSVMGMKEYLDHTGRFISQQQADDRVAEMHRVRQQFLQKLEANNNNNDQLTPPIKEKKRPKKKIVKPDIVKDDAAVATETTPAVVIE